MIEKPPILSDEQINDAIWNASVKYKEVHGGRVVATAQRDADAAYYEPKIEQAKAEVFYCEQAKAEVAREIVDKLLGWTIERRTKLQDKKIGQGYSKPADVQTQQVLGGKIKAFQEMIDKLQSLKSHYLKEG